MPRHVDTVLPRVGALVEGPAFSPYLSGEANLRRFDAADRHAPRRTRSARVAEALERVGLSHAARKKVHAYSLGMKQRLGIANALLMRRELLVLDEPTNGLDPQGTREVRALIRSFADDGTTVFVSSHLLAEVEQVCSHVGVMSVGRMVAQGTLDEFRDAGEARVLVRTPDAERARAVLARLGLAVATRGRRHPSTAARATKRRVTDAAGGALVAARLGRACSLPRRSWPRSSRRACGCAGSRSSGRASSSGSWSSPGRGSTLSSERGPRTRWRGMRRRRPRRAEASASPSSARPQAAAARCPCSARSC